MHVYETEIYVYSSDRFMQVMNFKYYFTAPRSGLAKDHFIDIGGKLVSS